MGEEEGSYLQLKTGSFYAIPEPEGVTVRTRSCVERRAQLARVEVHRTGFSLQQRGWEGGQGWVPWPLTEESASWEGGWSVL